MRAGVVIIAGLAALVAGCRGADPGAEAARSAAVVAFGRQVFFDPALSADGQIACATCHQPDRAYSDGKIHASGTSGKQGTRNAPSLLDVGRQRSLFWDGRRARLEDQALDPLLDQREHGLTGEAELLGKLRGAPGYAAAVQAAYGVALGELTASELAQAVAAFERTLVSAASPFDRFFAGQRDAIPEAARHGWVVFDQQAHCTRCHIVAAGDRLPPLFTDHAFHSLAVGFRKVERKLPRLTERLVAMSGDRGRAGRAVLGDPDLAELGRFVITLDPRDIGAFKTPSLRNVAVTAPYMHDGSVATLAAAIDLEVYRRGANDDRPLILTPTERADLVAFLHSLTGDGMGTP